jgi:hypothetical protein
MPAPLGLLRVVRLLARVGDAAGVELPPRPDGRDDFALSAALPCAEAAAATCCLLLLLARTSADAETNDAGGFIDDRLEKGTTAGVASGLGTDLCSSSFDSSRISPSSISSWAA